MRRCSRSAGPGTSIGTRASARLRLARTIRCATVASLTRKARAISAVVSEPTRRMVRATRASVASTGWQAVKIRLSRSSSISSPAASAGSSSASRERSSTARPSSSSLRAAISLWRSRSIARFLAVAISQAPGLSGTPVRGHRSSAARSASWARSSATPTSPVIRASAAISRVDSILQTASIARRASRSLIVSPAALRRLLVVLRLLPDPLLLLAQLGRELLAEVLGLEDLADFDRARLVVRVGAALDPLHRLLEGAHLHQPVAGDQLLGLGEGAVDHGPLAVAAEADPHALGGRVQALPGQQHPGFDHLLVELAHRGEHLLARHLAGLGVLVRLDDRHHSHPGFLSLVSRKLGRPMLPPFTPYDERVERKSTRSRGSEALLRDGCRSRSAADPN